MASNKECLVIIIDVREGTNKSFKEKAIRCAADILKEKICAERKDEVTFVLMGTKRTKNLLNDKTSEGYLNIFQYEQEQLSSWRLFREFLKFVEEEPDTEADWLDALIVALEIQHEHEAKTQRFAHRRILLFHNFDGVTTSFDGFDDVAKALLEKEIGVIVVSNKIGYTTNPKTSQPQAVFQKSKNFSQDLALENETYALRLVSACNAQLCNFDEALLATFKLSNSRPWTWQGQLMIGSQIKIAISGIIAIKDENNIKMKKCWGERDELPAREMRHYRQGEEMDVDNDEIITGYMLGATPIPFDETIEAEDQESAHYETGIKFLGFVKINSVPEEYFTGDSLYWIVHRRGMVESARKLDALVQALHNTQRAILGWKIYSAKHNTPKLVVLLPNKSHPDRPATLSMIEMTYHAQHHYWDFPTLITEKTKCNKDQLDAIDELMDSMDLMLNEKHEPRQTFDSELLAFNTLPHIFERNMMDILERKVLCTLSEDDEQFQKMLAEKNFVEAYWKIPELNEEKAKRAAGRVRDLFPLEKNTQLKRNNVETVVNTATESEKVLRTAEANAAAVAGERLSIECVGMKTPDDDFEKLIKHRVLTLKDKTSRDKQFNIYAEQMRSVIWRLIFETDTLDVQTTYVALDVYRKFCLDLYNFKDYNTWITAVKAAIQKRKDLHELWHEVIKGRNLGLCFIGQPTLEEIIKIDDFYALDSVAAGAADEDANISK